MQASTTVPMLSMRVPKLIFNTLFSFEATVVLFLYAGRYKADPRFSWIPVDLTLFFFALSVVIGLWLLAREKIYLRGLNVVSACALFIFWCVATYGWTPSQLYAKEKVYALLFINLWCIIASAIIIANKPERVRRFFLCLMAFGAWMTIESIRLYFSPQWSGYAGLIEGDYLGVGRAVSAATTVGFGVWMFTRTFGWKKILATTYVGACFFVLLIAGGKGPLFAFALSVMVPLTMSLQFRGRKILAYRYTFTVFSVLALGTAVIFYIIATGGTVMTIERMTGLFTAEGGGASATARVMLFTVAWENWFTAPILGHGIGSFPILAFGLDIRSFPHNMFLEVLVENGIIGLVLLLYFLYTLTRDLSIKKLREEPALLVAVMLITNMFFNAMVTGDLPDNRFLFVAFGLLVMRSEKSSIRV